jgi:hypothetical protein
MKKSSDFDHEIKYLVEKNAGTPAILGKGPVIDLCHYSSISQNVEGWFQEFF